jgi:hypothetical protein
MSKSALKAVREPTGAVMAEAARIKLQPLGTPLRAQARAHMDGRLVLEAELPWLQLGAACTSELSDGRSIDGTVHWIGLDMTRDGTARLRILVDTNGQKSIQLSVSDADVEELLPFARPKRQFRWMLPILIAGLAGAVGWFASHALEAKPQLLAAPETPVAVAQRPVEPAVVKIPEEKPAGELFAVYGPPAPTAPIAAAPTTTATTPQKPVLAHKIVRKRR